MEVGNESRIRPTRLLCRPCHRFLTGEQRLGPSKSFGRERGVESVRAREREYDGKGIYVDFRITCFPFLDLLTPDSAPCTTTRDSVNRQQSNNQQRSCYMTWQQSKQPNRARVEP